MNNQWQLEQTLSFSRRLKQERRQRGWSQAKVAELLNIETKTVYRWERGDFLPASSQREKLGAIFQVSLQLFGLADIPEEVTQNETPSSFLQDPAIPLQPAFPLIGRSEQLTQLKQRLFSGNNVTLSALNGLPGVGKTALSITLAHDPDIHRHFKDGVLWAGLGPDSNEQSHLSRWGSLLGISSRESSTIHGITNWSLALHKAIGDRTMLLIIDDVWTPDAALAFKVGGSSCAHVFTTRFPGLGTLLASGSTMVVPELNSEDGLALLRVLAPLVVGKEPELAHEVVRAAGGLPLALTLLGNYLRSQSYAGSTRRIVTALQRLQDANARLNLQEPRAPAERHSSQPYANQISLKSIIEVTDQQLTEDARQAFYALSAFPPKPTSFSEEAALVVASCSCDILDQLLDAGLLEYTDADRYTLHQTIADYASISMGKGSGAQERLITYYIQLVTRHRKEYELLEQEEAIILHTIKEAFILKMHSEFSTLVLKSCSFLLARGLYDFAASQLQHVRGICLTQSNKTSLANALFYLGQVEQKRRHYQQAIAFFEEGIQLARFIEDYEQVCAFLASLGWVFWQQADLMKAEKLLEEGLALANLHGYKESACAALRVLGSVSHSQGRYEQAEHFLEEGIALAKAIGDREQQCVLLIDLGVTQSIRGEDQAEQTYREALNIARQLRHNEWIILALLNLGDLLLTHTKYAEAKEVTLEGVSLAHQTQQQEWLAGLEINLGVILYKLNEGTESENHFQKGFAILRRLQRPEYLALCIHEYGKISLEQGKLDQAEEAFQEMLCLASDQGKDLLMLAWYGIARICAARGEREEAYDQGMICLQEMERCGHRLTAEVRAWLDTLMVSEEKPIEDVITGESP